MLHYLDDMDAKINGIQQFLRTQVSEGSKWSTYHRAFEQFFYASAAGDPAELPEKPDKNGLEEK